MRRVVLALLAGALVLAVGVSLLAWLGLRGDSSTPGAAPVIAGDLKDKVARGEYLAIAANCGGCHTERGSARFAGGRALPTAFGEFRTPNLTPDTETGIGSWSEQDLWRALHEGKRPDGAPLYPSFPYTHYTVLSRADSDAIYAYLRTLPAVSKPNMPHTLGFPYNQRWLLVAWRALFFRPGAFKMDTTRDATWNRGAYLVQGLAHCGACHDARNSLGAIDASQATTGGNLLNWYAPSLNSSAEAGVAGWSEGEVVSLLQTGASAKGVTLGPMAEVVYDSLQHLHDEDIQAMAAYLRALPDRAAPVPHDSPPAAAPADTGQFAIPVRGSNLYETYCGDCHGKKGEGLEPAAPALAGNRAVTMASSVNPIRMVIQGGYAPGTKGNPQPYGMPPFGVKLTDQQIADILSYVRTSWGNTASKVQSGEVSRQRDDVLW